MSNPIYIGYTFKVKPLQPSTEILIAELGYVGFDSFVDSCRFDGILDLFNRIDINSKTGEYTSNFGLQGQIDKNTTISLLYSSASYAVFFLEAYGNKTVLFKLLLLLTIILRKRK